MGLFSKKIVSVVSFITLVAAGFAAHAQEEAAMPVPAQPSQLVPVAKPPQIYRKLASELRGFRSTQSTLLGGLLQPLTQSYIRANLTAPNGRTMEAHLWKAKGVSQGLYLLIPGLASDAKTGLANSLAETMSNDGYDVFVLANPFSVAFQTSFSSDGLVGFPQKDRHDLDIMMLAALKAYYGQYGVPRMTGLIGYSMGGLYTVISARQGAPIKFDRYIALNPPVNFTYAMNQLDDMLRVQMAQSVSLPQLLSDFMGILTSTFKGLSLVDLDRLHGILPTNDLANRQVIGMTFAGSLNAVTENLASTEAFSNAADRVRLERAAPSMTYNKYMGVVGTALVNRGYFRGKTFAQLSEEIDLRRLVRNKGNANLYVIHNEDDVLVRHSDLRSLGEQLGERLMVFDAGGHCGNYWVPSFKRQLKTFIKF